MEPDHVCPEDTSPLSKVDWQVEQQDLQQATATSEQ